MGELNQKIEEISIAFVMADLSDLQALADIYRKFEDFANSAINESQNILANVASFTSKLVEKIIIDEVHDKSNSLDAISKTIGIIQSVVSNQCKISEAKFPDELGIPSDAIEMIEIKEEKSQIDKSEAENNRAENISSNTVSNLSSIGDNSLVADFINEAREHLHEADVQLLTLENDPQNYDSLNAVYRAFHTIKGVAGFLSLNEISSLAHATEDLLDHARKGNIILRGKPIDVTFSAIDSLKQMVTDVENALTSEKALIHSIPLSELLITIKSVVSGEFGDAQSEKTENLIEEAPALISIAEEKNELLEKESSKDMISLAQDQVEQKSDISQQIMNIQEVSEPQKTKPFIEKEDTQTAKSSPSYSVVKETLKIEAERLDKLVDMIGELVIAESMVTQDFEIINQASARVARNLTHLNKITRELQEIGMSLRMMPVRPVFERMARLARDLAKKSNKRVEFSMSGEDTEIDKSVVEKISDPLTHMIRNAVDHGIESETSERTKQGKSEISHVSLRAYHKSGDIIIEVEDDGKGLDKEAILAKAKEKGMIDDCQSLTEQEIFNLIFMPGFSTAKTVTDVSGRGVGMDVVNRNIQSLRGQIEIHSIQGKGTTFALRLPLTLAIMDGIIVQVGSEQYIIPTLSVVESIRPKADEISTVMGNAEMLSIRCKLLPMFRISGLFQVHDAIINPTEALIVIVEDEGKQVGFMVDSLVGHQQIVIKSLGESFGNIQGISGGAIMADGRVGLILDVTGIVKLAISSSSTCIMAA